MGLRNYLIGVTPVVTEVIIPCRSSSYKSHGPPSRDPHKGIPNLRRLPNVLEILRAPLFQMDTGFLQRIDKAFQTVISGRFMRDFGGFGDITPTGLEPSWKEHGKCHGSGACRE